MDNVYCEIITILKKSKKFIKDAKEKAEWLHDDMNGEYYLSTEQYEIMCETDQLLKNIDSVLSKMNGSD